MKKDIFANDLTMAQQKEFTDRFYELWGSKFDFPTAATSPTPWGMPWLHGHMEPLVGMNVLEMAKNWFDTVKQEINICYYEFV